MMNLLCGTASGTLLGKSPSALHGSENEFLDGGKDMKTYGGLAVIFMLKTPN